MKLTKHAWMIWGIALIVVITLMILIPFARTTAWWIAAACIVLMFGLCAFTFVRAFRKDESLESKVLGWPIFKVGYTALAVQVIIGFLLMAVSSVCPAWAAGVIEAIIFAATAICLTLKDAAREAVSHTEAAVKDNTAAWKAIRAKATALANSSGNPELKKLADAIRYADPTPTGLDGQIAEMLVALSNNATAENIQNTRQLLDRRNVMAKAGK